MVRDDGRLLAADLMPVAELCGLGSEQVRSCLRRLVDEAVFVRSGTGRSAEYTTTPLGQALFDAAMERRQLAYDQDARGGGWDRRWHLVSFGVPEKRRKARASFRDWMLRQGAAPLQSGLYVSPHPWEQAVQAEASALGVTEHIVTNSTEDLTVGGVDDPREIAAGLWPLDEIADRYNGFIEEYADVPTNLEKMRADGPRLTDAQFVAGALAMVVRYQSCQDADPLLPPELLPRDWPGKEARRLAHRCRELGLHLRESPAGPTPFQAIDHLSTPLI
jgi:phenylacetic acid degradation operon negative regulatory protein